jgi:hypothetical protein
MDYLFGQLTMHSVRQRESYPNLIIGMQDTNFLQDYRLRFCAIFTIRGEKTATPKIRERHIGSYRVRVWLFGGRSGPVAARAKRESKLLASPNRLSGSKAPADARSGGFAVMSR